MMSHKIYEQQQLCELINQWNENRLDLFNLSQPNEVFLII